jgi:glycosyltransferase involved in cell wall biosynthesis
MKILIDMQSVQAGSAKGGIGRYAYNLLEYILKNNQSHDISILLNAQLSMDNYDKLILILPKHKIHKFYVFPNTQEDIKENDLRSETSKLTKEYVVSLIDPDIFFITSLIEGFLDNVVTSVGEIFPAEQTAVILYDLIPLAKKEDYLTDELARKHYMGKISDLLKCGLLLSISEYSKTEAIDMIAVPENKIINISSGVDEKFKHFEVALDIKNFLYKKYHIKKKFLMYTGSFDIRKNQENLIRAFALLDPDIQEEYQLLLIGNGTNEVFERLTGMVRDLGLEEYKVIFLGYIEDNELLNLYNLASLFVFPTFREGFGLPALEAMSCAIPTIGSNTTSITEVINNPDAFFDPSDINSIADKIRHVLSDEDFANSLKTAGLSQAKNFSWDITAIRALKALEKQYQNLDKNVDPKEVNNYDILIEKIAKIENIKEMNNAELRSLSNFIAQNINKYHKGH